MAEAKGLSADKVMAAIGNPCGLSGETVWKAHRISVRRLLTLDEYISVVRSILDSCSDEDGNIIPELIEFAIRVNIITAYSAIELPEDGSSLYAVIFGSNLYEVVCGVASERQINAIRDAVMLYAK